MQCNLIIFNKWVQIVDHWQKRANQKVNLNQLRGDGRISNILKSPKEKKKNFGETVHIAE